MESRQGIKLFIVLLCSTLFIYGFSHFGALAYNATTSTSDQFEDGTRIGSLDVSSKTKSEAVALLIDSVTNWKAGTTIELHFKEKSAPVDLEIFKFEIDSSVQTAISGTQNLVIVSINQQDLRRAYKGVSPDLSIEDIDEEKFGADLSTFAMNTITGSHKVQLESYLTSAASEPQLINKAEVNVEGLYANLEKVVDKISSIQIEGHAQISLTKVFEELEIDANSEAMSVIASGIYESILPTNFKIVERNTSLSIPSYSKLGYEAKVDVKNRLDFVFSNPNESSYLLDLKVVGNLMVIELTGSTFLYEYKIASGKPEEFKPKTVIQYSPQLKPNEKMVKQEGKNGIQIKMKREVYGDKNELLRTEFIAEDFYPPVHRIEVHGLTAEAATGAGNAESVTEKGSSTTKDETTGSTDTKEKKSDDDLWGQPSNPK